MDELESYVQNHLIFDIRVPLLSGDMRVFELVEKARSSIGFSMKDQFSRTFIGQFCPYRKDCR